MNSEEKVLWPNDPVTKETKLHPLSDFSDFLPQRLRSHLFSKGVLESELPVEKTPTAEEKRIARNAILGIMVTGLELHAEDFRDSKAADYWEGIIELWQLLHDKSGTKLNITAHNPFMWGKNTFENADDFLATLNRELPAGFKEHLNRTFPELDANQIESLVERSAKILFDTPREYPLGSGNFNFEMSFPSGYLDQKIRAQVEQDSQDSDKLLKVLAEITSCITIENWKKQIEQMLKEYDVRRFTFHMAPIGAELDAEEFERLKVTLKKYAQFARKTNVIVQMETQGISQTQYEELFEDPELSNLRAIPGETGGWSITLDLAHMDIEETWNVTQKEKNKPTTEFWEARIKEGWVTEIHVSAKPESKSTDHFPKDTHWRIGDDIGGKTGEIVNGTLTNETDAFVPGFTVLPPREEETPTLLETVLKRQDTHPDSILLAQEANASIADVVFLKGLKDAILEE
ncbi:MAG TPA: hypothetical protein ENN92_01470 [candidate division WWE3 bacterium]|uniref:Xylose isomerase-like TIM barrel domain-containing protein n=1 Tax=candidate division WWE3 bacterium TaxID=2053526 RepID=A0A7C1HX45_UNCKA|nr:hypothetical protein [candidate division WWE3 bacterium]